MANLLEIKNKIIGIKKAHHRHTENLSKPANNSDVPETPGKMDISTHQKAETALHESVEKLAKAFLCCPDAIAITTIKDGRFIAINDGFTRITGGKREETLGRTAKEISCWESMKERERIVKILEEQGRVYNEEVHLRMKSGKIVTALFSGDPIEIDGEPCMVSIARDITETKQALEAIKESEEFSTSLLENAPNPITVIHPDTSIKYVNPAFEKLTGFSLAEIIGKKAPFPWWPQNRWSARAEGLKEFMEGGGKITEQTIKNRNGELIKIEMNMVRIMHNGEFKYYLAHWNDITERKQNEEKLKESEVKFRILAERSPNMIFINKNGAIVYANKKCEEVMGYTREEFYDPGFNFLNLIAPESKELVKKYFNKHIQGEDVVPYEYTLVTKDGTKIEAIVTTALIKYEGENAILGTITDITEQKKVQDILTNEATWRRIMVEQSRDGIVILDQNGKVYEANRQFGEILGYSPVELLQLYVWDWDSQHTQEQIKEMINSVNEDGDHFETGWKRKDGTIVDVEISTNGATFGERKLIFCVCRDITSRKRAEEALKEAEYKYRDLLDNTNELIQSVTPDGRFRYVNNGWKQALSYSEEEIAKMSVFDIVHPDYLENYRIMFRKITAGEKVGQIHTAFVSKNGSKVVVEGNVNCKYENGEVVYTRSILRDITENKYLEDQMFRLSSAVSMSTDYIVITDFDANIIDINQKTLDMYGADSKDELLGRHFLELIYPPQRGMVNEDVAQVMEKGYLERREYTMVSKHGQQYPVQVSTSLVRDADGKPMGMVRVGRELSNP
ncbi:MAG TPA: PAS domain S-box protein [Dehalococcoidia bacterium]|nr:PAS domain S-box protein [Dehalococcoidia bacterium]